MRTVNPKSEQQQFCPYKLSKVSKSGMTATAKAANKHPGIKTMPTMLTSLLLSRCLSHFVVTFMPISTRGNLEAKLCKTLGTKTTSLRYAASAAASSSSSKCVINIICLSWRKTKTGISLKRLNVTATRGRGGGITLHIKVSQGHSAPEREVARRNYKLHQLKLDLTRFRNRHCSHCSPLWI